MEAHPSFLNYTLLHPRPEGLLLDGGAKNYALEPIDRMRQSVRKRRTSANDHPG